LQSVQVPGVTLHSDRASQGDPGPVCGSDTSPRVTSPQHNPFILATDSRLKLSFDPSARRVLKALLAFASSAHRQRL